MCSHWGSTERTARGYTRDVAMNDACGEAAKMLVKEGPYNQADGPYDPEFNSHTMMDPTYESTEIQMNTMMERFSTNTTKYGPEPDSAPLTSTD